MLYPILVGSNGFPHKITSVQSCLGRSQFHPQSMCWCVVCVSDFHLLLINSIFYNV